MAAPSPRTLYIFGAGGFGREVAWLARSCWGDAVELVHLVDRSEYLSDPVNGHPVRLLSSIEPSPDSGFVVGIGDPSARQVAAERCRQQGLVATSLIHPRVERSDQVEVSPGAIICAGNILTTNIRVEEHAHVNLACTIGHDAVIGAFATLSPGVHVSGHVRIGRGVFIGTGANIINGQAGAPLVIGDGAVVAAGACVTKSVEPGALVAGVPAIRKR